MACYVYTLGCTPLTSPLKCNWCWGLVGTRGSAREYGTFPIIGSCNRTFLMPACSPIEFYRTVCERTLWLQWLHLRPVRRDSEVIGAQCKGPLVCMPLFARQGHSLNPAGLGPDDLDSSQLKARGTFVSSAKQLYLRNPFCTKKGLLGPDPQLV